MFSSKKNIAARRDGLEIMIDILKKSLNPTTQTNIVYSANLNFKLFQRHVAFLEGKGLIEAVNSQGRNRKYYRTTDKGREFLSDYTQLGKLLQLQ